MASARPLSPQSCSAGNRRRNNSPHPQPFPHWGKGVNPLSQRERARVRESFFPSLSTFPLPEYTFHMSETHPSHLADSELPIPAQYFELYGRFWDVASLLIFSLAAIAVLITNANELTWRAWTVAGLSIAQGLLYFLCITRSSWPISRRNLALYFVGGVCMWGLSC